MRSIRIIGVVFILLLIRCSKDPNEEVQPIQYALSTTVIPTGAGTITGLDRFYPVNRLHDEGTVINLVASPDSRYSFVEWKGSIQSSDNPVSVIMDSDKEIICLFKLKDTDEDGVTDDLDLCWNTAEGEEVDENGCSDSERDSDGDGILDISDTCPNTPLGEPIDENGCSDSQKDTDGDGVTDETDLCNDTPPGENVGAYGCPLPSPVYLGENGVTVKCYEWGEVGEIGVVDGVAYTIVDEALLRDMAGSGGDVSKVCTTRVTNMSELFQFTPFNQDISSWDVSNVTDMSYMFFGSEFNQPIGAWHVSRVTDMSRMFEGSPFNQPIGAWDVSRVTDMSRMFKGVSLNSFDPHPFNQDISSWDVSKVTNMSYMFAESSFNRDISSWDVSRVTNMSNMFSRSLFNQPLADWDVGNVIYMNGMFYFSSYNQDLSLWNVSNVIDCTEFSENTPQWLLPKPNFTNCDPN